MNIMERKKLGPITLCKDFTEEVIIPKKMLKYLLGGSGGSGSGQKPRCACNGFKKYLGTTKVCCDNPTHCDEVCGENSSYCCGPCGLVLELGCFN